MNYWLLLTSVAAAFGIVNCEAADKPLEISGPISAETLAYVKENISNSSRLTIRSPGGDGLIAIQLSRLLREHNITIVVKDVCLSACAQFVVPGARKVEFVGRPLFGMHHTATALKLFLEKSGDHEGARIYERRAAQEVQFYKEISVDKKLLLTPLNEILPVCIIRGADTPDGFGLVASRRMFFVPSNVRYRRSVPQDVSGAWAQSPEQVESTVKALGLKANTLSFTFDSEPTKDRGVSNMPICSQ